jgi:type IV secretory pathway VirB3-like protein
VAGPMKKWNCDRPPTAIGVSNAAEVMNACVVCVCVLCVCVCCVCVCVVCGQVEFSASG